MTVVEQLLHPTPALSILPNAVLSNGNAQFIIIGHLVCHADRGIALLDTAPDPIGRAAELLRAMLSARGFSVVHPGYLPIVYLQVRRSEIERLAMAMDGAFAADQPMTIAHDGAWVATALWIVGSTRLPEARPVTPAQMSRASYLPVYAGLGALLLGGGMLGLAVNKRAVSVSSNPAPAPVVLAEPSAPPEPPATPHADVPEPPPAPVAPVASPEPLQPAPPPPADFIALFISKGNAALDRREISAARALYEHAAELGSAEAASLLAWSYDPANPKRWLGADVRLAARWQGRAAGMALLGGGAQR